MAALGLYSPPQTKKRLAAELASQIPAEYFLFYTTIDEPIGFSSGHLMDSDTFSWSGAASCPLTSGVGCILALCKKLLPYLSEIGVERVTSNHMGTNRPVLIAKLKAGFNVTGVTLDERYGMMVWLTYFLRDQRQKGFEQAFSLDSFS